MKIFQLRHGHTIFSYFSFVCLPLREAKFSIKNRQFFFSKLNFHPFLTFYWQSE